METLSNRRIKFIVCGGRKYYNYLEVDYEIPRILERRNLKKEDVVLVQGGAQGADFLAKAWAYLNNVPQIEFRADWKLHKNLAGPIRNAEMLAAVPTFVIAFPGGAGTADMVRQSKAKGVDVYEISSEKS